MSEPGVSLAVWVQRLGAITANANELSEAESTLRVRARAREGRYSGLTKQRAETALAQLNALMDDYLLLARVVDEASQVDQSGPLTSRSTKDSKIATLLQGPSITRLTNRIPIAARALLGSAQAHDQLTPDQLLDLMQQEFTQARDTLAEIDAAQLRGEAALSALRQDYAAMTERAGDLMLGEHPTFIEFPDLQSDPLNAQSGMESLKRALSTWAAKINELEGLRAHARASLESAKSTLDDMCRRRRLYDEKVQAVRELLGAPAASQLPHVDDPTATLSTWYETLENCAHAGQWRAISVGVNRLSMALASTMSSIDRGIASAQARCDEVADLAGRFAALKAKELALTAPVPARLPAHDMAPLRAQIETTLHSRPLDIDAARTLLGTYQHQLLALSQR